MDHDDDHDDKARPVSGEIMSGAPARTPAPLAGDVSDAQYETVSVAGGEPAPRFDRAPAPEKGAAAGMDFLKAGAAGTGRGRGGPLFWACGLLLVALAFWISGGHALVGRGAPGPAAQAPAGSALHIAGVTSRIEAHDGRSVLFVEGRAENRGGAALALPGIGIAVTANDGAVTRYHLATRGTELKPGDRYSFSSRLEAPDSGVRTVSVAFQEDER